MEGKSVKPIHPWKKANLSVYWKRISRWVFVGNLSLSCWGNIFGCACTFVAPQVKLPIWLVESPDALFYGPTAVSACRIS
jgi:hypothetical protein